MLVLMTILLLLFASAQADELTDAAAAERQATIDAARQRAEKLRDVLEQLEAEITAAEARTPSEGKRVGERTDGKIVNGILTGAYPTTGALIHGSVAASAGSHCSGTLIGPRTFLTAAHCVAGDADAAMYHVYLPQGGIFAIDALTVHPEYAFPHADLAVLRLASAVEGIAPTPLNDAPVSNGSRGDIVGFGRAGGMSHDYGIKRAGTVLIGACGPGRAPSLLCWKFDDLVGAAGLDSNTCNADSGGPLYVQRGADKPLLLAGVTSGGSLSDCLIGDESYDVDVVQFADWITATADGDLVACEGSLPSWGSDDVHPLWASVDFTATLRSRAYTVTVPAGIRRLRVAMNGHDEDGRNFDLYVKAGENVSSSDNDCAQDGDGQYAFCEFTNPVPGVWSILINAANGSGTAQVYATMFGG